MRKFDWNFKLLLISKVISVIGGNILGFAMILFLVEFTQSAALLGVMSALSAIPALLVAPFAGVLADRLNKKNLILLFDFLKALCCFGLLALLTTGSYTFWNITWVRVATMTVTVLAMPVFTATVPRIVKEDHLVEANGMIGAIGALGLIGGSIIGGVLFGVLGIVRIALFAGILNLLSAIIDLFLKIPHQKQERTGSLWQTVVGDLGEGVQFLRYEKPHLFKFNMATAVLTLLLPPVFTIGLPFIVSVVFQRPVTLSFAIAALGMLLGGVLAGNFKKWLDIRYYSLWVAAMGIATVPLGISFMPGIVERPLAFHLFNFSLFALLFILSLMNALFAAYLQKEVPEHLLGKVDSLLVLIERLASPIGILGVGFFIESVELPLFFLATALIIWLSALSCQRIQRKLAKSFS